MISVEELRDKGKVYTTYPAELREAVARAMEAWQAFCVLPEDIKMQFPYEVDKWVSGNGYELKKESGDTLDQKENFHLRLRARDELLTRASAIGNPEITEFVEAGLVLPELIAPLLADFAQSMEEEFGMTGFAEDVAYATPSLLLRFLHYFGDQEPGKEIASPHVDKGGFTLHLYESDKGVEQLTFDGNWTPVPVSHEQTVIFPALGLQYRLKSDVKAMCHKVVATEESAQNGRFSAVCFVDFRGNVPWNKEKFGRQQDLPPGFNYTMPWEEFKTRFNEDILS
ncbi:MAG: 2OG-Fe(II) oxygenase family protein [Candidatus Paceibacterota bacterium]